MNYDLKDTITALSTGNSAAAIAVIRVSGNNAFDIVTKFLKGKELRSYDSHTIHFRTFNVNNEILDEVLISIFKAPNTFTGEDLIEISCHGSVYIQQRILQALIAAGARLARAGEFTQRAYINGKLDLSQAEAVGDLIASESSASHNTALKQMRGGFSNLLKELREKLINFASLLELELDFSEEDVEFADRAQFISLLNQINSVINSLIGSFTYGNAIKNGVATVIAGKPNAGKSTLLNRILNEERAIVSDIPGTTRDTIEEAFVLDGIKYRLIDTAGIRESESVIEQIGIKKTFEKINQAALIIYLFDINQTSKEELNKEIELFKNESKESSAELILAANKIDSDSSTKDQFSEFENIVFISSKTGDGIESLFQKMKEKVNHGINPDQVIVTNIRHVEALQKVRTELDETLSGMQSGISGELLAMHVRQALFHLGSITGEISSDDLLGNIFSKFCIGK